MRPSPSASAPPSRPERTSWEKMPAWNSSHSWLGAPDEVARRKPVLRWAVAQAGGEK
jgi:hypothetical protein